MSPIFRPFVFKETVISDPQVLADMGSTKFKEVTQSLFEYKGNTIVSVPFLQKNGTTDYKQQLVGVYQKTNMLGHNSRGRRVFEYSLDRTGDKSVFAENNTRVFPSTQKLIDTFMQEKTVTMPGAPIYTADVSTISTLFIKQKPITEKEVLDRMKICKTGGKI
jgi:hypothetical protein